MYDTGSGRYTDGTPHQSGIEHVTASETCAGYDAAPSVAEALAGVEAALARLADVDLGGESNRELLDAAVGVQALVSRLVGQQLRIIDAFDRRDATTWTTRDGHTITTQPPPLTPSWHTGGPGGGGRGREAVSALEADRGCGH